MDVESRKIQYFANRREWRTWLSENFDKESEVWLVNPKKASGKPKILYNDAVEEALCFGWIDSIIKTLDENNSIQRYTPRKPNSNWAQTNIERLRWLNQQNMLHPTVSEKVQEVIKREFCFPDDILNEIRKDDLTWQHYQNFSDGYKRIRIAYIDSVRKYPEEFQKRLNNFMSKTRQNKMMGYGGIEKYY